MIERLLEGSYERIRLFHVRMAFSEDMEQVGKFAFRKISVLLSTILRIYWARFRYRTTVLYYPPGGPQFVPVMRDIVLLCSVRWLFRSTVFHFHAGGVSGFITSLPWAIKPFFRLAYDRPALAIRTAPQNPDDGLALRAARNAVVPNGIPDARSTTPVPRPAPSAPLTILFTGVLIPSKGVKVLLEAFAQLLREGVEARLELMGKWGSAEFRAECEEYISANGLNGKVTVLGVLKDQAKHERFANCAVFCFPSYFEAESFGLVLVEAMQFAKPVVSTRWRGIPSVVDEGVSGFLVPTHSASAVAEKLKTLARDPELRERMGKQGRRIFEERFTLEAFHRNMEGELALLGKAH